MKRFISLSCVLFLVWIIGVPAVLAADEESEEKESEAVTSVSKEESSDEDGVIANSIDMKLKLIKAGEFMMGSKKGRYKETSVHKVKITKPFYIGVYEVTQAQYEKIMGENPSEFKGPNRPVECVSWNDAVLFCKKLSEKEGVKYRLPTEAEWEYACRAGTKTEYYWGDEIDGRYAWYDENCGMLTRDVGKKKPNAWGLYDMSGNVWEWCSDWYGKDYYTNSPKEDPKGPRTGDRRIIRGGCWLNDPLYARSAYRKGYDTSLTFGGGGFRVVREVE